MSWPFPFQRTLSLTRASLSQACLLHFFWKILAISACNAAHVSVAEEPWLLDLQCLRKSFQAVLPTIQVYYDSAPVRHPFGLGCSR
eukprot:CAMPEP_0172926748 /NCGR_PEP_ID=MMETSP1075-20121228/216203_1 /TAXON_ID=2916 /ORGANISM="Ceratium fusus, Strain PA161109" /LENGTH=85 /DNA_ID=CAMNT_0013787883 /DNA_START=66 /DNA_END=319 /DNA_ORIENTATION=+